ncbi:MAG: hypothetical protein KDI36_00295 [Pseudomonadales bacterium]|nr:hypothetical protein [Pseudomonadales bacterium]
MAILSVGLTPETVTELKNLPTLELMQTTSVEEASKLIEDTDDVSTVMVDSHASSALLDDVNALLGHTPVTTRIVVIAHPNDMLNRASYSALGVTVLSAPFSSEELRQILSV